LVKAQMVGDGERLLYKRQEFVVFVEEEVNENGM
jgi:hypothetical protein